MANHNAFPTYTVNLAVATTAPERADSLDGIDTITMESWVLAAVKTGTAADTLFYLDRADSTTPADGTTVIAPLAGPGRWKLLSLGGVCDALTRVAYVDQNTTVPTAYQTGSICAPYSTIQAALDNTLPISATPEGVTVLNLILIVPGFYDQDLTIPQTTHVSLQGLGGLPVPSLVVPGNGLQGSSVYITDPTFTTPRIVSISYSNLDGSTTERSIPPYIQFAHIAIDTVDVNADGADALLLSFVVQSYDNCMIIAWNDVGTEASSYKATVDVRDSTFSGFIGVVAIVMFEHSEGFTMTVGIMSASDCILDDLTVNETLLGLPFSNFALVDTVVNSSLTTPFGEVINLDTSTSFLTEDLGSIATSQARRVQDNLGTAYHHRTVTDNAGLYTFDSAISCVFRNAAAPGPTNLPLIDLVLRQQANVGQLSQQRIVKNMVSSLASTTVTPFAGNTINGGVNPVLAPGESIVLVPQSVTNWEVIAKL